MTQTTRGQQATVVGVFGSRSEAERAVADLHKAGFAENQVSLIGKHTDAATGGRDLNAGDTHTGTGAATGAAVGAGAAALASLGMSFGVIPVIGPVLAIGPLAAALLSAAGGAAAGSLVGALIGAGIPEDEANYYEGEVKSGRFLVTVRASGRADEAWTILQRYGASRHGWAAEAKTNTRATQAASTTAGEKTVRLHEEQLRTQKQPVETGEVRVRKEVVTEHRTVDVPVQREEVVIERHPVTVQAASGADIRAGEEVRIPVREEKVQVTKTPVVKEEVTVGKRKVQDVEHVAEDVRREEIRVEQEGDVDVRTKGKGGTAPPTNRGR